MLMGRDKILAAAHHFGSANALSPVIKRLNEDGEHYRVFPLAFGPAEIAFKENSFNFRGWDDFEAMNLEEITVEAAAKVIGEVKPNLVLVGSSTETEYNGPEKALTIAAKRLNVPTVGVLDFRGDHALRFRDLETGKSGAAMPEVLCVPDRDAVFEIVKNVPGVDAGQMEVTGNPFYDSVLERAEGFTDDERSGLRREISDRGVALFYIANAYEVHRDDTKFQHGYWDLDNLETLSRAMEMVPDADLGINLHYRYPEADPKGHAKLLEFVADQERMRIIDPNVVSSLEGSLVSDVVLTPFSMDAISAATAGKFVISMQPGYEGDRLATNGMGVTYRADDADKVGSAIYRVLEDPDTLRNLCPNLSSFKSDGKATERIVDEITATLCI